MALSLSAEDAEIGRFVDWLLEDKERLHDIPFSEVVEAVSGCRVLAVDPEARVDAKLLSEIRSAAAGMLRSFKDPDHPIHQVGRINETSRHIEAYLLQRLNDDGRLKCTIPLNAAGETQHSGYPDLRLEHLETGRVFYLDPKVYKAGSETSSFRTFYFEPKKETNKILDDASHLILGVAHSGKTMEGSWQFDSWQLIDLSGFRVRLKAEFQASNRDLYREEAVLLQSKPTR